MTYIGCQRTFAKRKMQRPDRCRLHTVQFTRGGGASQTHLYVCTQSSLYSTHRMSYTSTGQAAVQAPLGTRRSPHTQQRCLLWPFPHVDSSQFEPGGSMFSHSSLLRPCLQGGDVTKLVRGAALSVRTIATKTVSIRAFCLFRRGV